MLSMILSSCGMSGDNDNSSSEYGEESYNVNNSGSGGYSLRCNSPMAVRSFLANSTFEDSDGNRIKFEGNSPMHVYFNGTFFANDLDVVQYGTDDDGGPVAVISVNGTSGHTSLVLTELDTDYGGRLKSKIVIYDVNDPNNLFYKTR